MKKIIYGLFLLALTGCFTTGAEKYAEWKNKNESRWFYALSCPTSDPVGHRKWCGMASHFDQSQANQAALISCGRSSSDCIIVKENDSWVYSPLQHQKQKKEMEMDRYVQQCEYLGFKKNTEKMADCALKIYQTEVSISALDSQAQAADSADSLNRLLILNEGLKLLNPPRRNFNCQARPFGTYTNVYCN